MKMLCMSICHNGFNRLIMCRCSLSEDGIMAQIAVAGLTACLACQLREFWSTSRNNCNKYVIYIFI